MDTQTNHQMVIHDSILTWRIGGIICAVVSAGDAFLVHFFKNFDLIFLVVGLLMVFLSADLTIIADRTTRTLRLEYRYLLFHTAREIPFDEIDTIHTQRSGGGSRSSVTYRIVATLKDGRNIPFRSISSSGSDVPHQAARLQAFISHTSSPRQGKDTPETSLAAGSDYPQETA